MASSTAALEAIRPGLVRRLADAFSAALSAERERWALWLPVAGGGGIAAYFAAPVEPLWGSGAVAALLALGLWRLARPGSAGRVIALGLAAAALGFAAAQAGTALAAAPMLDREIGPITVEGTVAAIDVLSDGRVRVILEQPHLEGVAATDVPRRVRVRLAGREHVHVGQRLAVRAVLNGPSEPVAPGAFDFRRWAYFQQIGAIGYAVGQVDIRDEASPGRSALWLEHTRQAVASRIRSRIDDPAVAAITVALLTGERGGISEATNQALRDAGLAHLLAISGLHLGLVAGIVFFTVRLLLAACEFVALRWPIKKWAAVVALAAALAYMLLVGAPVPTQRAFIMTGLVLVAILADRTPISMRLVAWAAVVVLAVAPDSLTGASFQMSFAAVVALVACYEAMRDRLIRWRIGGPDLGRRVVLYVLGVALTTVVASAATAPFALFHFQRMASYGLAANLLAVPLTAFWIMPAGLLSYLLMPFGLDGPPLTVMGWGIALLLEIAGTVAAWPAAAVAVPAMPPWGLAAISLGGLWLCLWRGRVRLLGLAAVVLGLASLALVPRPDVLVSGDGRLMAVRSGDGDLIVSSLRVNRFDREIWLRRNGQEQAQAWPPVGAAAGGALRCDPLGCLYRRDERLLALVADPRALAEDCAVADVVVARVPVRGDCPAEVVVDRFDLWRHGAHALTVDGARVRVRTVTEVVGDRPWTRRR